MIIDAHTHIDQYKEKDLEQAIEEINQNKILTIANSTDVQSYLKNKEIALKSPYVVPTFGIHPWKAKGRNKDLERLIPYIEETPIIGEIGLDFFWVEDKTSFEDQLNVFEFFLSKAAKLDKVVNIHTKGAEDEVLKLLDKYSLNRVIIHWYSGPRDTLLKLINKGYYFTISTELFYSDIIKEIANTIPQDKILVETDGPEAEEWLSGNIGMPMLIKKVVEELAKIKGTDISCFEEQIEYNFKKLIGRELWKMISTKTI